MSKSKSVELQETHVKGPRGSMLPIKKGEQFCWINPNIMQAREATTTERFIELHGHGPFVLDKIIQVPAGYILFQFSDEHGKEQSMNRDYFTTYERRGDCDF